jgi:glycosyltransferase involved in cell wall biosynthesis
VLFVEAPGGFGGSVVSLLQLIEHLPSDVEPVLVTHYDLARFAVLPRNVEWVRLPPVPEHGERRFINVAQLFVQNLRRARLIGGIDGLSRFDLIHANNIVIQNLAAALVARRLQIPVVSHQRDLEHPGRVNRLLVKYAPYRRYVAISRAVKNSLTNLGVADRLCAMIYNPIAAPAVPDRRSYATSDPLLVTMHSIIRPEKGHDVFLRAMALLVKRLDVPFRAVIAGVSPTPESHHLQWLMKLAGDLGIADRVEFRGHVRDVYALLAQTDVAVHAATNPEPFGRVIAEAMVCGTPVIATDGGGASEIVRHEETGLLVPSGDEACLAAQLEKLLLSPELRRALGTRGRQYALAEFDPALHARRITQLYREALATSG